MHILAIFLLIAAALIHVCEAWSYDPLSPTPPSAWGKASVGCSKLLAPWQSPVAIEPSDLQSMSSSKRSTTASCLITSVINSSEPLQKVPMILKRLPSGLLVARPGVRRKAVGNIRQGITLRIAVASNSNVTITEDVEVTRQATDSNDLFVLEAVAIHTGSEHAAQVFGAVAEIQFILNPIASNTSNQRTTVISVPLVIESTTDNAMATRLASPARSFVSQLLREIRALAKTATPSDSSVADAELDADVAQVGRIDGDRSSSRQESTEGASVLEVAVAGLGGLSGARHFFANTVPFLPVPVRLSISRDHEDDCHSQPGSASDCKAINARMVSTATYLYEGTLTFPPCLPLMWNSSGVSISEFKRMYQPNSSVQFVWTTLGGVRGENGADKILISIPTVRHIVTLPFQTSQQTIDSIALLTGLRTSTVTEVSTAPAVVGPMVTKSVTTHFVPITTSRPAQQRGGRRVTSALTFLPLFQDVAGRRDYSNEYFVGQPSTIVLGVGGTAPTRVQGLMTISQGINEHHIVLMRQRSFNTQMEDAIIILSFLCAAALSYVVLLLLVRFDVVEIPTVLGGKRLYVDFWTNPHDEHEDDGVGDTQRGEGVGSRRLWGRRGPSNQSPVKAVDLREPSDLPIKGAFIRKAKAVGSAPHHTKLAFDLKVTTMTKTPSARK